MCIGRKARPMPTAWNAIGSTIPVATNKAICASRLMGLVYDKCLVERNPNLENREPFYRKRGLTFMGFTIRRSFE